jgi:hypothetical protein
VSAVPPTPRVPDPDLIDAEIDCPGEGCEICAYNAEHVDKDTRFLPLLHPLRELT